MRHRQGVQVCKRLEENFTYLSPLPSFLIPLSSAHLFLLLVDLDIWDHDCCVGRMMMTCKLCVLTLCILFLVPGTGTGRHCDGNLFGGALME